MAGSQQIDLLFGVKGGGNPSGASGARIQGQINSIVGGIKPIEIKVNYTALLRVHKQLEQLSAQIDAINAKPLKIATGVNGSGKGSTSGKTGKGTDPIKALEADARKAQRIINTLSNKEMKFLSFDKALGQTKSFGKAINELKDLSSTFSRRGKVIPIEKMDQAQIDNLRKYIDLYNKLPNKINSAATATKKMKMRVSEVSQAQRALNGLNSKAFSAKGLDKTLPQVKRYRDALAELKVLSRSFTERGNRGEILPATQLSKTQLSDLKRFIELYNKLPSKMSAATAANKKYGQSTTSLSAQVKKAQKAIYGFGAKEARLLSLNKDLSETKQLTSRLAELKRLASTFTGANGKIIPVSQTSLEQVANLQKYIDLYDALPTKIDAASAATRTLRTETTEGLLAVKAVSQIWGSLNKMKGIDRFPGLKQEYLNMIDLYSKKTHLSALETAQFATDLKDLENRAFASKAGIRSFTQELDIKLLEQVRHLISSFATMFVIQGFRTLYRNVLEVDTAMTELKKVTKATSREYVEFLDGASERAKKLGASLKEVINATADYARMGYSIEDASQLADTAIVYQNVGDGLQDIDEATSHLISTMTAFGKTANDAMHIVDIFNEVANNYAVSAADIGTGLKKSAAAMSAAGNSLEETVALFTAANTIAQDAEVVGTALKTMSMRLRSTKSDMEAAGEDTEGMADSVSSLRDEILALTGVDIQLDDNTYKSSYQMLKDIAAVWDKLDDLTRANVLERLFGKRQANIGSGLLENFEIADKALATALDSSGSALRENEEYLESIQGHLDQLSASFQTFAQNFLDSEFVKAIIDLLRGILDFFNGIIVSGEKVAGTFGQATGAVLTLITALTALDALWGFMHVGKILKVLKVAKDYFAPVLKLLSLTPKATAAFGMLSRTLSGAQMATYSLFSSLAPLLPLLIALVAIISKGIKAANESKIENQLDDIRTLKDEYEGLKSEIEELNSSLEVTTNRITELENKDSLTIVEQEEINKLKRENELLESQISYKEKLLALEKQKTIEETQDAFYNTFGYRVVGDKYKESSTYGTAKGYSRSAYLDSYKQTFEDIAKYERQIREKEELLLVFDNPYGQRKLNKEIDNLKNLKTEAEKLQSEMLVNLLQWRNDLSGETDEISQAIVKAIDTVIYGIANGMDTAMLDLLGDSRFEDIFEFLKGKDENISEFLIKSVFGESLGQEFINALSAAGYSIHEVTEAVNELESESPVEVEFAVSTEELDAAKESVKSLSSSCKTLADAFKEQNENGSLSVDTILDVIDAGYGAALAVDAETGAVTLNADMYLVLAQAELAATKLKWLDIRASYEQQYAQAQEAISTGELGEAYKDLAEAELAALTAKGHLAEVDAILKSIDSIDLSNVTAGIYGIGDAASDAKSKLSNLQSGMETLLSQTVSWLKDEYSRAQDAQEKYYESQIDALEEAKDAAKERWDAEKEALEDVKDSYNDIIDAQIELLKRQKDADDYAKNRAEKEKAVSDIEAQLLAIENDDSIEAQKMRLELEEQLKEAQDELDELQSDREYELREQTLQDEKDRYNDEIDAKIEAVEKQSEAEEKAYQERINRLQDYLDAVRDVEKTEAQWRAEAYDWIENHEEELYQKLIEWNRIYGDGRDSTVEQWFKEAEGWKAWGNTFAEARENLARYLYELAEAVGGVAKTTTTLLEDVLNGLDEYQQKLLEENNVSEAKMVENLINNISNAVRHGMDFGEESLEAMQRVLQEAMKTGDIAQLEAINKMLGYYNEIMLTGKTSFSQMYGFFREALIHMDADALVILQGIYNNIKSVVEAAMYMRETIRDANGDVVGVQHTNNGIETRTDTAFSEGGVVDYTGPAKVHGSHANPEIVFNAEQAAKLYDYVVNTPNLLKSAFDSIMVESPKLRADPIGMNPTVGDININISGNADADTVSNLKKVAETLKQEVVKTLNESMNRRGLMRSPRLV